MDIIETKSSRDLLQSLLAEVAKAQNELRCARADLDKAQNRLKFSLLVLNTLIERQEINR